MADRSKRSGQGRSPRQPPPAQTDAAAGPATEPAIDQALKTALKLLSLRARSRHEIQTALERRGHSPPVCAAVLARLDDHRYLDDARFARDRATALLRQGRFGARSVVQRLTAHGIDSAAAKRAVAAVESELGVDPAATARAVLASRSLGGRTLTPKEKAKAARLLLGRGFAPGLVAELLGEEPFDSGGE